MKSAQKVKRVNAKEREHMLNQEIKVSKNNSDYSTLKQKTLQLKSKTEEKTVLNSEKRETRRNICVSEIANKKNMREEAHQKATLETVKGIDENKCPYCEFQCKRASALKFHMDFKHKGEKNKVNKRKAEVTVDLEPVKKQKSKESDVRNIIEPIPKKATTSKLPTNKLNSLSKKESNITFKHKWKKDSEEIKNESGTDSTGEITELERVFIIDGNGIQETENKKVDSILGETSKEFSSGICQIKETRQHKKWLKTLNSATGEIVFLEQEMTEQDTEDLGDNCNKNNVVNVPNKREHPKPCTPAKDHVKANQPSKHKVKSLKRKGQFNPVQEKISELTEPSKQTSDTKYKCPFCEIYSYQMKSVQEHVKKEHRNKTLGNNKAVKKGNVCGTEKVKSSKAEKNTISRLQQCPFCSLKFPMKQAVMIHIKNFHENKALGIVTDEAKQLSKVIHENSKADNGSDYTENLVEAMTFDGYDTTNETEVLHESSKVDGENVTIMYIDENGEIKDISAPNKSDDEKEISIELSTANNIVCNSQNRDGADISKVENKEKNKNYCASCDRIFNSYQAYWNHTMITHNVRGRPFKCGSCPKSFVFRHQRAKHEETHKDNKNKTLYSCDHEGCGSVYSERKGLYRHLKVKHGEADPVNRLGVKKDKKVYFCSKCDIHYKNASSYYRHALRYHSDNPRKHECQICSKSFVYIHELKDHMFVHIHRTDISCLVSDCHFKTKKLKYLSNHLKLQHGQKVDIKQLGKHVMSKEQITAEELLDLFPASKVKEENTELDTDQEIVVVRQAETKDNECIELDKQIEELEAGITTASNSNAKDLTTKAAKIAVGNPPERSVVHIDSFGEKMTEDDTGPGLTDTKIDRNDSSQETTEKIGKNQESSSEVLNSTQDFQEAEMADNRYKCKTCSEELSTHRQLIKHKASEHPEDLTMYQCDDCDRVFFTQYDLKDHRGYHHHDDKEHICKLCGKRFPVLLALHRHLARHREKPVLEDDLTQGEAVCHICGTALRFKSTLTQHMLRMHPETVTCSCKICSAEKEISEYVNEDVKAKLPFCDICNTYFCKKPIFESHLRVVHNTTGRHTCKFCPEKFSTISQMNFHMHQVHTVLSESVEPEGAGIGQVSTLNDDTQIIEINNDDQSGPKFLPKLSEQGLKAVTKELKIYSEEGGEKHWKCLLCAQSFSKVKYFNLHVRRTHILPEHQPYRCKICSAGFVRVGEFRKHTRSHSGFRPLKCRMCHKSFKQQAHLKDHMLTHSSERNFKCELCPNRFKQRGALLAHVVKHDKLRPFKCHFCGAKYTVRGALSKHMKKYTGNENSDGHLCHICHKTFSHYPVLLRHIQIHQAPKPFICETCNESYAAYTSLYFHKLKESHFRAEEYETASNRKYIRKGAEVSKAVDSLQLVEGHGKQAGINPVENATVSKSTGESVNQEMVEIIVKTAGTEVETTAYEVETHADEELLSIAKQLTEMSTYPGHEVYVDADEQRKIEEEEQIMMTMLDADEEVKTNLERNLMLAKVDNKLEGRESDTGIKVENTYIQILQYVDENGVPIENVDENGIPVEHAVNTHVANSISDTTVQIQNVDGKSIQIEQVNGDNIPVEYVDENGERIQHVYVDENGIPVEHIPTTSVTNSIGNEAIADNITESVISNRDENNVILCSNETSQSESISNEQVIYQMVQNSGTDGGSRIIADSNRIMIANENEDCIPAKEFEDHVIIAEGKIIERSGSVSDKSDRPEIKVEMGQCKTDAENGQISYKMATSGSYDERPNVHIADEIQNEQKDNKIEINIQEYSNLDQNVPTAECDRKTYIIQYTDKREVVLEKNKDSDTLIMPTTSTSVSASFSNIVTINEERPAMYSSQLAKALTEDNFNVSYTQSKRSILTEAAAQTNEKENFQEVASMVENIEIELQDQQSVKNIQEVASLEVNDVDAALNEQSVEEQPYMEQNFITTDNGLNQNLMSEKSDLNGLTLVDTTEYAPPPELGKSALLFKKQDGSIIYICVGDEQTRNMSETSHLVQTPNAYIEQDTRDYSTLEAAENLKSLAGTAFLKVSKNEEKRPETKQVTEYIHVYGSNVDTTEIEPGHPLYDVVNNGQIANLDLMRKVVKSDDSSVISVIYECPICRVQLKTRKYLRDHLKRHNSKQDRPFGCTVCPKRFVTKTELDRHTRIHSDSRPCECEVCGKRFRQPGHLVTHKRLHTGEKPYGCNQCEAKFTTSSLLKMHLLVHTEERNFECSICLLRFKAMKDLKRHRAVHSGIVGRSRKSLAGTDAGQETDSGVICHLCGKYFKNKYILKAHIASEENLREFKCEDCNTAFNTRAGLHYHRQTHETKKICKVCGKFFKRLENLNRHMKIQHGEGRDDPKAEGQSLFPCPACNKPFNHRGALYYHIGVSPDCMAKGNAELGAELRSSLGSENPQLETDLGKEVLNEIVAAEEEQDIVKENNELPSDLQNEVLQGVLDADVEAGNAVN